MRRTSAAPWSSSPAARAASACCSRGSSAARARAWLEAEGVAAAPFVCDVGDRSLVEQTVTEIGRWLGPIDVLVNNAGIIQVGPVAAMTAVDFADALATNFWGMVHATLAVLPAMRRRRPGRIVNITSIGGKVAVPRLLPYTASKFAAVGFSEGLAAELAGDDIVVVTVDPGLMPGRAVSGAALEPTHPAWLRVPTRLGRSAADRLG